MIKHIFWKKALTGNKYVFNAAELKKFLELNGFCRYKLVDSEKLLLIINNIAKEVTPQDTFNYCLRFVEIQNNQILTNDFYNQGEQLIIRKKVILGSLTETNLLPLRDNKTICYIFYSNLFLEISKDEIKLRNYSETASLNGFIWKKSIINRGFIRNNEISVIELFLKKITNNELHFKSVISANGYLLHKYKNPSLTKVIIISDENTEAENQPNGGTGKGIFVKAIAQLMNVATQNGKNLDLSNNRFAYQDVNIDTNILFLDDVKRNFNFEQLFNVTTNDMTIEKKNKPSFTIPFELSPKIVITTNHNINGDSSSHNRRKFTIFFNNYFSDLYAPFQEFKHLFFNDWDETEWNRFDTFMVNCIKEFLREGLKQYEFNNELRLKKLRVEIDDNVFSILENKCDELETYYSVKELGLGNLKQVKIYAEYKNYEFSDRRLNGCTEFKFSTKANL
ncbi:DUF5906 domain-containing protein [Chryseobacterium sp. SG20098]|uniref:primase-helicase family protein n=1 Tax=Chryseobacterium sp. SG20098 TaxID=3074145 RepID=UPI0028830C57|nr:DUF5906 domain-containing protein [Chryseobacterium sp. SG20098]WNI35935.1 hypothetical protein RHP76_18425 [Chryseobacterium sp. SG20098]